MPVVTRATDEHATEVGHILAVGFELDPVLTWVFAEPGRAAKLRAFFGFLAREALVPLGATYLAAGGTACWTPPDSPPWPDERGERFATLLSTVCTAQDTTRLGILDAATTEHHPTERHWYLGTIATLPDHRGRGIGTALVEAGLAVVDHDRLPAYLESTNPRNISLYERHGFIVTAQIELPDGPTLAGMWRDPVG